MFKRTLVLKSELKNKLRETLPRQIEEYKEVKKLHGDKIMAEVKVSQVLGGMRGIPGLFYETSKLDANKGILYRNTNLFELVEKLKYKGSSEPLPEALLWYLFTGLIPNESEIKATIKEIEHRYSKLHLENTEKLINSLPKSLHPMTQLSMGVLSLQENSKFAKAYREGVNKTKLWEHAYEDSMDLISALPRLASLIYNNVFHHKRKTPDYNPKLNYAENFANMLGFQGKTEVVNYLSHYLVLHADHEGGNVSAHATGLVGSALSDPYYSYSAGLNGLAGPLHGLANQEVLRWLLDCHNALGPDPSDTALEEYTKGVLALGKVIPGYGHAVLREVDPRYTIQIQFGDKFIPNDPLFQLVKKCYKVIPNVLKATGKVQNPWPNVDCSSGVILYKYGLKEFDFYTVIFGVSRALGVLPTYTCSRAYGLPIERPGSVNLQWIKDKFSKI